MENLNVTWEAAQDFKGFAKQTYDHLNLEELTLLQQTFAELLDEVTDKIKSLNNVKTNEVPDSAVSD
jgi:hypothetical protein